MTDSYPLAPPTGGSAFPATSDPEVETPGTAEIARDEANDLKEHVADAGSDLLDTARGEVSNVVGEATSRARNLAREAREELRNQADAQQQRVAAGLRSVGDELSAMAKSSDSDGVATNLVHEAALRADKAASWLAARDAGSLLTEVKTFAARRPGVFIAGAVIAGVLAGRLTRSVAGNAQDDTPDAPGAPIRRDVDDRQYEDHEATAFSSVSDTAASASASASAPAPIASAPAPIASAPSVEPTSTPVYSSIAEERGDAVDGASGIDELTAAFAQDPQTGDVPNG